MSEVVLNDPRAAAKVWLEKAWENMHVAGTCWYDYPNATANRCYYAAFQSVIALFRSKRQEKKLKRRDEKTHELRYNHGQLQRAMLDTSAASVARGLGLTREFRAAFVGLKEHRIRADYEEAHVDPAILAEIVDKAQILVHGMDELVRKVTTSR